MVIDLKQYGLVQVERQIVVELCKGDIESIAKSIANGWDVNELIGLGNGVKVTPVVLAILNNDYKTLDFLVANNANLDLKGYHAFLYAVRYCDVKMARHVASLGARIRYTNKAGLGAYELACEYSNENKIAMFELFSELGLQPFYHAGQALIMEVREGGEPLEYLLLHGAEVNVCDKMFPGENMTPLIYAIIYGNMDAVRMLLEYGADVSQKCSLGTPHTVAVQQGQMEIANYLMKYQGVKVDSYNKRTRRSRITNISTLIDQVVSEESLRLEKVLGGQFSYSM